MYLGLTRETAQKTMMAPVLKKIDKQFKLGCKFGKVPLSCTLPNGSVIYLAGVNTNDGEQEKLLGQKYKMIVVDECASYTINLKQLLNETLGPATIDQSGQIIMIGTPGNFKNYFYDITVGAINGWSKHHWLTSSNPHTAQQYKAKIAKLKREQPGIEDSATFKQHYLAQWVIDESKLLYKFSDENLLDQLPGSKDDYFWTLALDLGWTDPNSFVVSGYSATDPTLYYVHSFVKSKMLMDEMIYKINEIKRLFTIQAYVIDSANKQYVEELRYRTRIPLEPAQKIDKMNNINMLNTDLITKRIRILKSCTALISELNTLLIDDSDPAHPKELAGQSNHCADAFLYGWRKSLHYLSAPKQAKRRLTPEEQMEEWERKMDEKFEREQNQEKDVLESW